MDTAREEFCFLNTPVGWLRIIADPEGVTAVELLKDPPLKSTTVTLTHLKEAYRQLGEYFRGERLSFSLPLNPKGTDFQKNVWKKLSEIPFGSTISYKSLAEAIGQPTASRAVGMANHKNPLPIIVPCHRVIGASGELTGYAYGLNIKQQLLQLEGAKAELH